MTEIEEEAHACRELVRSEAHAWMNSFNLSTQSSNLFGFISSDIFSFLLSSKIPQQCLELEAFALLGFFPITRAERYSLFIFFSPNFFRDKRTGSEPGARGSYLKDSEKAEMYKKHKEIPEVYTVERLAKDYRIMRQRVHAILWLKELEEEEEKKLGRPLDDSVELLLDTCPEFFNSHDREFHMVSLTYKPDFKVMSEGWDSTTGDLDEVHCEISKKENEMLYQEFVQRMNFNKMKESSIILTFP
ncbi:hypothetical protein ACFX1X_004928 [Malus domestica]|uniref:Uncharacterized protein n=2 Tax=Malus domestica TaxID=3750 RepID=A0A498IYG0_MALDO|nr:hypothetical protein DVH24_017364 [Malus domestica]